MIFTNRQHAGLLLAEKLAGYREKSAIVVGLARGGVQVAGSVSSALSLPLDVLVVKKIPSPYQAEYAIGALAPNNVSIIHWPSAHRIGVDEAYIKEVISRQQAEIRKKQALYRKGRKPFNVAGKVIILVDDGAATGATLEAAVKWLKKKKAGKIVLAIPVASVEAIRSLKPETEEMVVLETPDEMGAVGQFYRSFTQVGDSEVVEALI
ncbi:phosphoribosyltransferase [Patescibacteria group bacterium]|nr:phosphoribosyltransferase [Patescibacteria group bacterium]MBU1472977.1 phosphoribosyltransferase [Patescibacteria group bacterium]MBU2459675.1 phosphoribosyltransferase [Patescibacteria group bacterium]MBU2544587.1 phosphoribosyltransferase [Patescibacteria group bacterium]